MRARHVTNQRAPRFTSSSFSVRLRSILESLRRLYLIRQTRGSSTMTPSSTSIELAPPRATSQHEQHDQPDTASKLAWNADGTSSSRSKIKVFKTVGFIAVLVAAWTVFICIAVSTVSGAAGGAQVGSFVLDMAGWMARSMPQFDQCKSGDRGAGHTVSGAVGGARDGSIMLDMAGAVLRSIHCFRQSKTVHWVALSRGEWFPSAACLLRTAVIWSRRAGSRRWLPGCLCITFDVYFNVAAVCDGMRRSQNKL
jgi:hypothetical protein